MISILQSCTLYLRVLLRFTFQESRSTVWIQQCLISFTHCQTAFIYPPVAPLLISFCITTGTSDSCPKYAAERFELSHCSVFRPSLNPQCQPIMHLIFFFQKIILPMHQLHSNGGVKRKTCTLKSQSAFPYKVINSN